MTLVAMGALGLAIGQGSLAEGCSDFGGWTTTCVSNEGTEVDVGVSVQTDGLDHPANPRRPHPRAPVDAAPPAPPPPDCGVFNRCGTFTVLSYPDVTIEDLASFRPAAPALTGEPAGFGVSGMPTNFVTHVETQHLTGTLLGWDVVVRFTPVAFEFAHGDGTRARSATGGASWESLGVPQFTPTSTTHVYSARGTYATSAAVEYAAAVDFGGGWREVPGVVTATGPAYVVEVVEVHTALVDRTCLEDPPGPGC